MTKFHRELLECNYCLNEENVPVWDVVDAEEDPDLVEKILLKELQTFVCSNCQRSYVIPRPFLLIDRPNKSLIYFEGREKEKMPESVPRQEDGSLLPELEEKLPHDFGFPTEDFSLRLVSDYNALIEKIHIERAGLSDRLLEVLKLAMQTRLLDDDRQEFIKEKERAREEATANPADEEAAALHAELKDLAFDPLKAMEESSLLFLGKEGQRLLFQRYSPYTGWRQLELQGKAYDQAEMLLSKRLPAEGRWEKIDREWAKIFAVKSGREI